MPFLSFSFSSLSFYLSLHTLLLVSLRINLSVTRPLNVLAYQMWTRLLPNQYPSRDRREQMVLPGRTFWGPVFTLMITKRQSELNSGANCFNIVSICRFSVNLMCLSPRPPSQAQQLRRESMEYAPEERDYSLLPAPIHVGEYIRKCRHCFSLL